MGWITHDNGLQWRKTPPGAALSRDMRSGPQVLRAPLMGALPVHEIVMQPAPGTRAAHVAFAKA